MVKITPDTNISRVFLILIFALLITDTSSAQPKMAIDTLEYTMPPVKKGTIASLDIPFKNVGDQPLIITKAQGQGPPVISHPTEPILPNANGMLRFKLHADFVGTTKQTVMVGTNIDDKLIMLSIRLTVYDDERRPVSGVVTDSITGLTMGTVWVSVLTDRTRYTETDSLGKYTIMAAPDESLMFRLDGMKGKIIKASELEVNAVLKYSGIGYHRRISTSADFPAKIITEKDFRNAVNPRYQFKRSSKTNLYLLYISEVPPLGETDLAFQKDYKIVYDRYDNHSINFRCRYNKLVFKYLAKKFGKEWQTQVRKDAIGLDDFLK